MTLNEVPTDLLRESLLAIADLKRKYRGEPMVTRYAGDTRLWAAAPERCPLCRCHRVWRDDDSDDCVCPWYWIEGHGCEEFENLDGDTVSFSNQPIPDRVARCDRWTAQIEAELERRDAFPTISELIARSATSAAEVVEMVAAWRLRGAAAQATADAAMLRMVEKGTQPAP